MKQHTEQFVTELKKLGKEIDNVITYGNTTLRQELYSVTPLFEGNILKSIMKQLDVETSQNIPEGTIINYQFGLKIGNAYEYLNFGNYVVYKSEKQEDTQRYKLTCYDKMLYSMKQNEDLGISYPISIKNYLTAVATKIGLTVKNTNFNNQSLNIPGEKYVGLQYTYRDILDEIAQVAGGMIVINSDDQLEVIYPNNTGVTIDSEMLKDVNVNFGQKYGPINSVVLSRSGGSDNIYIRDEESIAQNGLCEVKIEDNQIMNDNNRDAYLEGLLAALDGIYYYINDFNSPGITFLEFGDYYNVTVGQQTYQCLMLNDEINITGGVTELVHTGMPEESVTNYEKADTTDRRINQTYLIVDKQNGVIESVVSETIDPDNPNSMSNKVSRLTQDVDRLETEISNVTGMVITKEAYNSINFEDIGDSEPVHVRVVSDGDNISYLYPRNDLYPSDTLYMPNRVLRFRNLTLNENIDWELPADLLYYDDTHYDEVDLNYKEQTCTVTKRVGYNADGTVYPLSNTIITNYPYPEIGLSEGDYLVYLPGYSNVYLDITLLVKNIYTDQFATKVELNSKISQTVEDINLSVNAKLSNYSTTTQMNAAIDVKANQITSTVSSTYSTKSQTTAAKKDAIRQAGLDVDDKLEDYSTTVEMNSAITQKANEITSTVSETYATKATTTSLSSRISQTAKSISLTVNNGSTSSGIEITTTKEDGTTSKVTGTIQMNGLVKFTDLSASNNYTTINGGNITTGTIKSSNYQSGTSGTSINLSTGVIDSKNFKINSSGNVTVNGAITSSNVTLTGGTIKSNNYTSGTSGTLINLSNGSIDSKNFKVSSSGNVTITGTINATAGNIGGCTISNGVLTVKNANIESINGGKISDSSITSSKISSLSADKISGGTINGVRIYGSTFESGYVYADEVLGDSIHVSRGGHYSISDSSGNAYSGKSDTFWIMTGWTEAGGGRITFKGRDCTFRGGIITNIGNETTATVYIM